MILPKEFDAYFRDPKVKAAWISGSDGVNYTGCDNCSGAGVFVASIAVAGPFEAPQAKGASHYHDGYWWSVITKVAECPVCHNIKRRPAKREYVPMPDEVRQKIGELVSRMSK